MSNNVIRITDKLNIADSNVVASSKATSELKNSIDSLSASIIDTYATKNEVFAKDTEQDAAIGEALNKVGLPLGFEYTRLTGQNAPLGGVDYFGQIATRTMYADLWAWLNENKPDAIVSESEWQSLYSSQNGNVPFYSDGDGSMTLRFPRVVGYFKGVDAANELGKYTPEGLPGHTHTRGTMNITGSFTGRPHTSGNTSYGGALQSEVSGAFSWHVQGGTGKATGSSETSNTSFNYDKVSFNAANAWTGETSQPTNSIYGNSPHVTPETVTVVMGVIAFGSVASIGKATEEGIIAELGEHGAKLGEHGVKLGQLEAAIEVFHDNCVGEIFPWPADSEPYRALPINGAAVSRTTYAKLFAKIGTKYGAGDGSTTFNVPNGIGKFLQCDNTAGTVKAAGLPNITGSMQPSDGRGGSYSGAIYRESYSGWTEKGTEGTDYTWKFDASRSNTIYGASTTVQPPALTMRYYIKY